MRNRRELTERRHLAVVEWKGDRRALEHMTATACDSWVLEAWKHLREQMFRGVERRSVTYPWLTESARYVQFPCWCPYTHSLASFIGIYNFPDAVAMPKQYSTPIELLP